MAHLYYSNLGGFLGNHLKIAKKYSWHLKTIGNLPALFSLTGEEALMNQNAEDNHRQQQVTNGESLLDEA